MPRRLTLAHALSAGQPNLPIQIHSENPPTLPVTRKGKGGRLLRRPQKAHPAATVADFRTAVLKRRGVGDAHQRPLDHRDNAQTMPLDQSPSARTDASTACVSSPKRGGATGSRSVVSENRSGDRTNFIVPCTSSGALTTRPRSSTSSAEKTSP